MKSLRFIQTRKRWLYVCDLCGAAVMDQGMVTHARHHANRGDGDGYRMSPGICENRGDRVVDLCGVSVRPT